MPKSSKQKFYAVRRGRAPGVYLDWPTAEAQVRGYRGAEHKSFGSRTEALTYLQSRGVTHPRNNTTAGKEGREKQSHCASSGNALGHASASVLSHVKSMLPPDSLPTENGEAIAVYCDGSSLGNGRDGARAGWGVWWRDDSSWNACGPIQIGEQTNNRGELMAILVALESIKAIGKGEYVIRSDSKYAISCLTVWGDKWEINSWTRAHGEIKNLDLVRECREKIREVKAEKIHVTFEHVKGHANDYGNERADMLARRGAAGELLRVGGH